MLQSIPIYLMSSSWMPIALLGKIDGLCRKFVWSKDGDSRGLVLVGGDKLCSVRICDWNTS